MSPFARSMLLAIAMLGLSWSPGTLAGEITYIFDFVVSEMSDYLSGGGVNIGDRGTMIFRVNAATEPSRSGPTFRDYPAAIIGGGVTIGALAWTFDGAGQGTNDATLFNDQSAGPGSPFLIDLFALQGPLTGPPVTGLPPAFFSVALAAERPAPNDALASCRSRHRLTWRSSMRSHKRGSDSSTALKGFTGPTTTSSTSSEFGSCPSRRRCGFSRSQRP